MSSLGLNGPYSLNSTTINAQITRTLPGNYALGYVDEKEVFIVKYVGRADEDLNSRLHQHIGKNGTYKSFKWDYATSPKAAFEKECHNYHDFGENKSLDNEIHPDRPKGSNWKCPVCNIFN